MAEYIEYVEQNCKLVLTSPVGRALVAETKGNLCEGCCYNSSCKNRPADQVAQTGRPSLPARPQHTETVREEAARRGISLSEVRRERNQS